jgi:hypothetical protein
MGKGNVNERRGPNKGESVRQARVRPRTYRTRSAREAAKHAEGKRGPGRARLRGHKSAVVRRNLAR